MDREPDSLHGIGDLVKGTEIGKADSSPYIRVACPKCKLERWVRLRNAQRECFTGKCNRCFNNDKMMDMQLNRREKNLAGKRRQRSGGYIGIVLDRSDRFFPMAGSDNVVREHRLVMAKHLGRCLQPWEVVHHINGVKIDNRLENLELFPECYSHNGATVMQGKIKELQLEIDKLRAERRCQQI